MDSLAQRHHPQTKPIKDSKTKRILSLKHKSIIH
jgi:hypothetical protein